MRYQIIVQIHSADREPVTVRKTVERDATPSQALCEVTDAMRAQYPRASVIIAELE